MLEDGDTVAAQSYLSRAQNLIRNTNDQETIRESRARARNVSPCSAISTSFTYRVYEHDGGTVTLHLDPETLQEADQGGGRFLITILTFTPQCSFSLVRVHLLTNAFTDLLSLSPLVGFKLSQARIYDSQRKFQEAASKYHEIR